MTLPTIRARVSLPVLLLACATAAPLAGQQFIGYVNTRDADTTGASERLGDQVVLTGSVSVTAKDHTAPITLGRGGTVNVCQTSALHLTESHTALVPAPLLFSLDRGAIEIRTEGTPNDSIMTPDLRLTVRNTGPLDLRLRVSGNGDTCVENRGNAAPTLAVSDPFGESMYELPAGQHVLFEHGSLHNVVAHESSSCGCPEQKGPSLADALLAPPNATLGGKPAPAPAPPVAVPAPAVAVTAPQAAAPAAIPQGAAAAAPVVPAAEPAAVEPAKPVVPQPAAPVAQPAAQPGAPPAVAAAPTAAAPAATAPAATAPVAAAPTAVVPAVAADAAPTEQSVKQAADEAAARAAAVHPFPQESDDGSPAVPASTGPPPQITDTLRYNAPIPPAPSTPAESPAPVETASATPPAPVPAAKPAKPPAQPPPDDLVHLVGRLFHKLFGRG